MDASVERVARRGGGLADHHLDVGIRHGRRTCDIVDAAFASACQAVRTNKAQCPFGCSKLLAPRTIDYHRLNGCRGKQEDAFADVSRKRSFICGACYDEFVTRDAFFLHLASEHSVEATTHSSVFPDYYTFQRFRYWLESQGGAHFRQKSGAKIRASGKGIFMMCNRSGLVHSAAPTGDTEKDKTGSYRTGFTCTAFINGTVFPDGHVSVRYCGDHYGHDARMRLPQSVKNIIMHQQMQGQASTAIIRYLQQHFMPLAYESIHAQRVALVDQEELRSVTPMLKKLHAIPFEKEEEWEDEFLEAAGVTRDYAPQRPRPHDWLPIKELALRFNWPLPSTFVPKVRNSRGDWMVADEQRGGYTVERERSDQRTGSRPAKRTQPDDEHDLDMGEEEDDEAEESGDVDVEGLRESKREGSVPSTSAAGAAAVTAASNGRPKRQRLDENARPSMERSAHEDEEEQQDQQEEDDEQGLDETNEALASGPRAAFLTSSIVAELDMLKALVKSEAEYLSEAELAAYLQRTRTLRLSFEPLPRHARGSVGQRDFAVPQLARPSRSNPSRPIRKSERTPASYHSQQLQQQQHHHHQLQQQHLQQAHQSNPYGIWMEKRDAMELDVCDEEIVVGTSVASTKMQYNSRLWT